jgi:hypothetical protein
MMKMLSDRGKTGCFFLSKRTDRSSVVLLLVGFACEAVASCKGLTTHGLFGLEL